MYIGGLHGGLHVGAARARGDPGLRAPGPYIYTYTYKCIYTYV